MFPSSAATSSAASSSAVSPSPPKDIATLMCVRAEAVRKKHSRGVSRKQIWDIGVSKLNRSITWKHAHYVLRQIFTKAGFTKLRYKNAMVHDANPDDLEEV